MKATNDLKNDRLIKALFRQPVDRTPVWMMRQAGRYLPEYRELRKQAGGFISFCQTPELACEATLQPLNRFDLDAAIVFSDILTVPLAMGLDLEFTQGEGPVIHDPIRCQQDLQRLKSVRVKEDLWYVLEAITKSRLALAGKVPLIGFAGSPWTVATYMVEGGSSKTFQIIKTLMYRDPYTLQVLLDKLTETTIDYLNAQIESGAQAVMVFDSWGGILSHQAYQEFSLRYLKQIASSLTKSSNDQPVPLIFFTKGGGQWLESIADSGCDAVGLDWTTDISVAKRRVGSRVALQGNMDPLILFAEPELIQQQVKSIIEGFGEGSGHVFNLGHGINKESPIENVEAMIEAVHYYGKKSIGTHAFSSEV